MPVVNTTSPVTEPCAPTASPSKRTPSSSRTYAVMVRPPPGESPSGRLLPATRALWASRRRSRHRQSDAPLPVGDAAGGDRREDLPVQPLPGERAVFRAGLVAGLADLPLGPEVDQH